MTEPAVGRHGKATATVVHEVRETSRAWWDAVAGEHGARPAVRDEHDTWSYAELDRRQSAIGAFVATRVGDAGVVGVVASKSAWSVAAILGTVHVGRTALLLDPDTPTARRAQHCRRAGAVLAFAASWLRPGIEAAGLPAFGPDDLDLDATAPEVPVDPGAPALIFPTSGSTGVPKLVARPHHDFVGAWRRNAQRNERYGDLGSTVLAFPPLTSAAMRNPLFQGLAGGACVRLVDTARTPPDRILAMLDDDDVHRLHLGPWLLRALTDAAEARGRGVPRIRLVFSNGAALLVDDLAKTWRWFPNARVVSHYGSTEISGIATLDLAPDSDLADPDLLAHVPDPEARLRVVEGGRTCAPGEQGEIWVASDQVVGRYVDGGEARTPIEQSGDEPGWVSTGDLGRLLPDGRLHIEGRTDARVKVNGIAVDLNAVVAAVRALDGVADAEVSAVDRGDGTMLVAWVVSDGTTPLFVRDLRGGLADRLPRAMFPHVFRAVATIPRLPNGKVDRVSLREAATAHLPTGSDRVPPSTPTERALAVQFEEVLECGSVAANDSFFELGGDSLGALELVASVAHRFAVPEACRAALESALLSEGTVGALARVIDDLGASPSGDTTASGDVATLRPDGVGVLVLGAGPADAVPIVVIPGGGWNAARLRPLARRLTTSRVLALTPRGVRTRALPDRSIAAMARRFADALLDVDPHGRFVLAGYSIGALVAYQTATELTARGATVRLLALLDFEAPGPTATASPDVPIADGPYTALPARAPRPWWARVPGGIRFRLTRRWLGTTAGIVRRTGQLQSRAFLIRSGALLRRFRPVPYAGAVLVVRSEESIRRGAPPDLGWSTLVSGPIESIDLPGDHFAILLEPSIARIAEALATAADAPA